jgi:hypothetical protein
VRTKLVGAALVGVVIAGSCGGDGSRLSTRGYVKASSAVCVRANRSVARIDVERLDRMGRADRAAVRIVAIHREAVDDLRALRPPKDYETTARLWIALIDQSLDELDAMRDALRTRATAEAKMYEANAVALSRRARTVAGRYGITACAIPDLTV